MNNVQVKVEIGAHVATVQLPVKITRFVNRPHTYEVNDIEQQIQAATSKVMAALGIERQQ